MMPFRLISSRDRRVVQRRPILIRAGRHRGDPLFVVEIPRDRAPYSRIERFAWRPAELAADARRIDRVTAIMSRTVDDRRYLRRIVPARPASAPHISDRT